MFLTSTEIKQNHYNVRTWNEKLSQVTQGTHDASYENKGTTDENSNAHARLYNIWEKIAA